VTAAAVTDFRRSIERHRSRQRSLALFAAAAAGMVLPGFALAGPLELRQGSEVGAGTGFRRGDVCQVLTAAHVVSEPGVEVVVLDRSGARATGQVTYSNPAYDIALVTLQPGFAVACNERWPDAAWMAAARWNSRSLFEATRHYPDGRESVVELRWAGGTADTLTLARTDRMEIRSADSGALVRQDQRAAGIVKQVDTAIDRVEVVRFDLIDRLIGERFRGSTAGGLTFDGVFHHGRPHANWTSYASAWLTEKGGRPLVNAADTQSRCRVRAEVIAWSQRSQPNPLYAQLQQNIGNCRKNPLIRNSSTAVKLCEDGARNQLPNTPRQLRVHSIQLKVDIAPRSGAGQSKLRSFEVAEGTAAAANRAQMELQMIQTSFGAVAEELFATGVCD
jgi:hypothetical protein